jgi:hypothetical protein
VGTDIKTSVAILLQQVCQMVSKSEYVVCSAKPGDQAGKYSDTTSLRECLKVDSFMPLDMGLKKFIDWAQITSSKLKSGLKLE